MPTVNCIFALILFLAVHSQARAQLDGTHAARKPLQEGRTVVEIGAGNAKSFAKAVKTALPNSMIHISADIQLPSLIAIEVDGLTILGNEQAPPTIRCASPEGGFEVRSTSVIFRHLIIRDCNEAAIEVLKPSAPESKKRRHRRNGESGTDLELDDVTITGVSVLKRDIFSSIPGAAVALHDGTRTKIDGCRFIGNNGMSGGAIFFSGAALSINRTKFADNTATDSGGAIHAVAPTDLGYSAGTIDIKESMFKRNVALGNIKDMSRASEDYPIEVEAAQFLLFDEPSISGGAIGASGLESVNIESSNFSMNTAGSAGGALFLYIVKSTTIQDTNFFGNRITPGTVIEDIRTMRYGGAVFVSFDEEGGNFSMQDGSFVRNHAWYGGALHATGLADSITVSRVEFVRNEAVLGGGGAAVRSAGVLKAESSMFRRNRALIGGAILLANGGGATLERNNMNTEGTQFFQNTAIDGGAIFAVGASKLLSRFEAFLENRAKRNGGAICLINSASGNIEFHRAHFSGNSAKKGGAIFMENSSALKLVLPSRDFNQELVQNNLGNSKSVLPEFNIFHKNVAEAGGAMYFRASNILENRFIVDGTQFTHNEAVRNLPEEYDVNVSTLAEKAGLETTSFGKIFSPEEEKNTVLDLDSSEPCHPGGGGAVCMILNALSYSAGAAVELSRTEFIRNKAEVGGALLIATDRHSNWTATCISGADKEEIDALSSKCRSLELRHLVFNGNTAAIFGGAILASNLTHVHYSDVEERQDVNGHETLDALTSMKMFTGNRQGRDTRGHGIAGSAVRLRIISPEPDNTTGLLLANQSAGLSNRLSTITVAIVNAFDEVIGGGITDSKLTVIAEAHSMSSAVNVASGQLSVVSTGGIANFTALSLSADPGMLEITFSVARENVQSVMSRVTIRDCSLGERRVGFVCEACPKGTFLLFSNADRCPECPIHANCSGSASFVPAAGYWQSSLFAIVMHRCFRREACDYDGRDQRLRLSRERLTNTIQQPIDVSSSEVSNDDYKQCKDGYVGPLCGSCAEGYGNVEGKFCNKCNSKRAIYAILFFLAIGQFLVVGLTLRSALNSIRDMSELRVIADIQITAASICSRAALKARASSALVLSSRQRSTTPSASAANMYADRSSESQDLEISIPTVKELVARKKAEVDTRLRGELIITSQHISEIIKIFINFIQVTSVAGSIDLDWASSLRFMLNAMSKKIDFLVILSRRLVDVASISGFMDKATFAPIGCLLDKSDGKQSIYGVTIRIALHVALLLILISFISLQRLVNACTKNGQPSIPSRSLASTVILCFLIVVFFGYQSVSEDLMGTVSCIRLDSEEIGDIDRAFNETEFGGSYSQFSTARDWYWTKDTAVRCWTGSHKRLALSLGFPGIALFLCGAPLWLFVLLLSKRRMQQLLDIDVLNTYGFIYQNYVDRFVYWEVPIMMRKALLGAIIVFAYRLEPNLQGNLAVGILMVALALHLIAVPYKYPSLNHLEGASLIVSISTLYAAVVFYDNNTVHKMKLAFSLCLIIVNISFVFVVIGTVFVFFDRHVSLKLQLLECPYIPRNPAARLRLLLFYKSKELKDVADYVAGKLRDKVRRFRLSNRSVSLGNPTPQ